MYKCKYCHVQSEYKYNIDRHEKSKHGNNKNEMYNNNNSAPNIASIANNAHPRSGNIITNERTSRCELDPSQVYNPPAKTVSIEEYNKANESAHGWKSAYDNLYNQTGSGINVEEVHKRGVEAIRNWEIALEKEKENNKQLKEELHYEKLAKEALPIHMNDKYLNIISILRGVKKGDNMGYYPNKMIHCICEALHNICWNADVIVKGLMKYKLKHELLPIKNSIIRLANPKYSMKKKRQILSKPKVGKGVFTAIASFVIPALLSILTKKST